MLSEVPDTIHSASTFITVRNTADRTVAGHPDSRGTVGTHAPPRAGLCEGSPEPLSLVGLERQDADIELEVQ